MSSLTSDDGPPEPQPVDQGEQAGASAELGASAITPADKDVAQKPAPAENNVEQAPSPVERPDPRPWLEPQVQTLAIFTELFRLGDSTEAQLQELLSRHTTTMAWTDFWAREGYLTEVVRGSERRFALSGRAVLMLELP